MLGSMGMKLSVLCTIVSILFLTACQKPDAVRPETLTLVNNYYIEHPPASVSPTAARWLFVGVKDHSGGLLVFFQIPKPMEQEKASRHAFLKQFCPPGNGAIRDALSAKHKLVIEVRTRNNQFSDTVDC
jgi:hypothetical protein